MGRIGAVGILLLTLAGCAAPPRPAAAPPLTSPAPAAAQAARPAGRAEPSRAATLTPRKLDRIIPAADPPPLLRPQVTLSVLRLSVPAGAVSANEAFWKRIDEQVVDIATHDLLYKNGLRIGQAKLADLDFFLDALGDESVQAQPALYAASGTRTIELALRRAVSSQIIYAFDASNTLAARSYEESDNLLVVRFEPAPRRADHLRISLCPLVRSTRPHLKASGSLEDLQIEYAPDEKFFELNLRTDVPLDGLLVVAPSPESTNPMSLGHAFLSEPGDTQRLEQVLLLVPHPVRRPPKQAEARVNLSE